MEIKWIEDFIVLADLKNFSQAAQRRNVTQPHFSRRIQSLERWLGATLIDRRTYPIGLTPAGKVFRETAQSIVKDLYNDKNYFRRDYSETMADIRISAATTLLLNYIPPWLSTLRSKTNNFTVKLSTLNFHDMVQALSDGDTDLVLQFAHSEIPAVFNETKFESLLLSEIDFIPVSTATATGDPVYSLPGTKDQPIPYFTYSADGYLALVEDYLQARNSENPIFLRRQDTSPTAEVLKSLILLIDGIAWLPANRVSKELEEGKLALAGGKEWITTLEIRMFRSIEHSKPLISRIWESAKIQSL